MANQDMNKAGHRGAGTGLLSGIWQDAAGVEEFHRNPSINEMPSKIRSASQARKDRAALKRLRDSGTYTGKIDLRKAPTPYQLKKIAAIKGKRVSKSRSPAKPEGRRRMPPKQKVPGATIKRRVISEK